MTTRHGSLRWAMPALLLAVAFLLGGQPASQRDLYYLCASFPFGSNGTLLAKLYRADAQGGAPQLVRNVGKGVDIVLADYDRRKLVVASPGDTPHTFAVIDMTAPEKEHSVSIGYDAAEALPDAIHLLEIPQKGLWVAMALGSMFKTPPVAASTLTAVSLEAEDATAESLPFAALAGIRLSGSVGGALVQEQQIAEVRGDPLHILISNPVGCPVSIPRPPYLKTSANPDADSYHLVAVNDSVVLLTPYFPKPAAADVIDIFDQGAHIWRRATLPFSVSAVRAFGRWVTAISTEPRGGPQYGVGRTEFDAAEFMAMRASPGKNKRMAEKIGGRDNIDVGFDISQDYFPGDLLVLNSRTDQRYTIHTGEGDSEVILATDAAVYYRVNDALFRADLVSGKLAIGVKIAEGPDVPQAHWAFLGPAVN